VPAGAELGVSRQYELERDEEALTILRLRLDEAALTEAIAAGRAMTVDEAVALAVSSPT
jgi:hypothetical protein